MRSQIALATALLAAATWTTTAAAQPPQTPATAQPAAGTHDAGAHHHDAAAAIKNPMKATAGSIAAGKKLYDTQCATCHGDTGKGDGKLAAAMKDPKPSDLADASWKHGATDGEIFTLIRDGSKGTGMRGYASRMKTEDLWNVVNYLRTLAPTARKSQ